MPFPTVKKSVYSCRSAGDRHYRSCRWLMAYALAACLAGGWTARGADFDSAQQNFYAGQYSRCIDAARHALDDGAYGPKWPMLLIKSRMMVGQYDQAAQDYDAIRAAHRTSLRLMMVGYDAYLQSGRADRADKMLPTIYQIASRYNLDHWDPPDRVALGRALLLMGAEPRIVLEEFFAKALKQDPACREGYLASGTLALEKHDYELAAQQFQAGLERFGDDPDMHYGLARAHLHGDRRAMIQALDAALHLNDRHLGSLVLRAQHQIDAEDYEGAGKSLDRVLSVNDIHPDAWALRAVMANLDSDSPGEQSAHQRAMTSWPSNPAVDFLIGKKLSQKYRFVEGADYQRQALAFDPDYLPAKIQLAQDLMRLGVEDEGWTLADEVFDRDGYDVHAYNLVTLRDNMADFETLQTDKFIIRMDPHEAGIYGDMVIELLDEAHDHLCQRYGLELDHRIRVEIFPDQQDFAIRTFGMPGGAGFLGVCFGDVITANSPKTTKNSNWQAVLWHEFCHVVTLNLTHNKMPRWLSEGISVYEESQRVGVWGQQMTPQYRRMILDGELAPIGKLSALFLSPPSPMHLQFAYYESSLVVEFIIDRYGLEALRGILTDLGNGQKINDAIANHTASLKEIEKDFAEFARERAEALAPEADWQTPKPDKVNPRDPEALAQWIEDHPDNIWALNLLAKMLLQNQQWHAAKAPLERIIELYPQDGAEGSAYRLLALAHRRLKETRQEHETLKKLGDLSADATDVYERLMELAAAQYDWKEVALNGERFLAVNPLPATPYQYLGRAYQALGQEESAIDAYQRLLKLDPADPADVNFRLAELLESKDLAAAKKHVMLALADAPRFRAAHRLLLRIARTSPPDTALSLFEPETASEAPSEETP